LGGCILSSSAFWMVGLGFIIRCCGASMSIWSSWKCRRGESGL